MDHCWHESCNRPRKYKRYCSGHQRQYRSGEDLRPLRAWVPEGCKEKVEGGEIVRRCTRCNTFKPRSEFRPLNAGEDKLGGRCKKCERHTARWAAFQITEDDYVALRVSQANRCALCLTDEPGAADWHIDHDHSCCPVAGKSCGRCIRGLLCRHCNTTILPHYERLPA